MPSGAGAPAARSWRVGLRGGRIAQVDLVARVDRGGRRGRVGPAGDWGVAGAAEAWLSVLAGQLNFGTAMRQGHLRYTGPDGSRDTRAPSPLRWDPRTAILTAAFAPAGRHVQMEDA